MGKTKHSESFDNKYQSASEEDSSSYRSCLSSPQNNDIWEEVIKIPDGVKPHNKLLIPGHQFIRKQPLDTAPVGDFGRRYRRPY